MTTRSRSSGSAVADKQIGGSGRRNHSSASPFEPVYGYSRAVRVGSRIDVAGCAPIEADGSSTVGDPGVQAARCLTIKTGRASGRERECQYVSVSGVAGSLKNTL